MDNPFIGLFGTKDAAGNSLAKVHLIYDNGRLQGGAQIASGLAVFVYVLASTGVAFATWLIQLVSIGGVIFKFCTAAFQVVLDLLRKVCPPEYILIAVFIIYVLRVTYVTQYKVTFDTRGRKLPTRSTREKEFNWKAWVDDIRHGIIVTLLGLVMCANPFVVLEKIYTFVFGVLSYVIGAQAGEKTANLNSVLVMLTQLVNFGGPVPKACAQQWSQAMQTGNDEAVIACMSGAGYSQLLEGDPTGVVLALFALIVAVSFIYLAVACFKVASWAAAVVVWDVIAFPVYGARDMAFIASSGAETTKKAVTRMETICKDALSLFWVTLVVSVLPGVIITVLGKIANPLLALILVAIAFYMIGRYAVPRLKTNRATGRPTSWAEYNSTYIHSSTKYEKGTIGYYTTTVASYLSTKKAAAMNALNPPGNNPTAAGAAPATPVAIEDTTITESAPVVDEAVVVPASSTKAAPAPRTVSAEEAAAIIALTTQVDLTTDPVDVGGVSVSSGDQAHVIGGVPVTINTDKLAELNDGSIPLIPDMARIADYVVTARDEATDQAYRENLDHETMCSLAHDKFYERMEGFAARAQAERDAQALAEPVTDTGAVSVNAQSTVGEAVDAGENVAAHGVEAAAAMGVTAGAPHSNEAVSAGVRPASEAEPAAASSITSAVVAPEAGVPVTTASTTLAEGGMGTVGSSDVPTSSKGSPLLETVDLAPATITPITSDTLEVPVPGTVQVEPPAPMTGDDKAARLLAKHAEVTAQLTQKDTSKPTAADVVRAVVPEADFSTMTPVTHCLANPVGLETIDATADICKAVDRPLGQVNPRVDTPIHVSTDLEGQYVISYGNDVGRNVI